LHPGQLIRSATVAAGLSIGLLACSSATSTNAPAASQNITVWLMNGSAPQQVVDGVNADFTAKHPNAKVTVEIQQWSDVTTKLDTAFAGSNPPDVVELGNTLVSKYAAAGALENLTSKKGSFENSSTWLQSLTDSCTVSGKLDCVPYYAGSRAIIYRKDMFTKAGVQPPTSLDAMMTAGTALMNTYKDDPNFSAFYFPGKYWYGAASFIWDYNGDIATKSGSSWQGSLSSANSVAGLTALKTMVDKLSRADKTGDEAKQDKAFAQGHIAMIMANGWEVGQIIDPKVGDPTLKDKLGVFPLPSHTAGQTAPVFLGGSDLAIAAKSKNQALAEDWVKTLAGTKWQTQMGVVGQVIPNTTTLLTVNAGDPLIGTFATAAKNSRFVPNSANWANVESSNILQDTLVSIFTGKATIADATKAADVKVAQILNSSS